MVISKDTSGLILQDDFSTLSDWSQAGGSGWTSTENPTMLATRPSDIEALAPTNQDFVCIRQPEMFVEDGKWTLMYDSIPAGSNTPGQFIAESFDRGLSWNRTGPTSEGNSRVGGGAGLPGVATGWIEKRGSTYYRHRVISDNGYLPWPNDMIAYGPYFWDIWSAADIRGSWSAVRQITPPAGTIGSVEMLPGTVIFDGSTYHAFVQVSSGTGYGIARATSSSPGGPFTIVNTLIASAYGPSTLQDWGQQPENPRVFYSSELGQWVLLMNLIEKFGTYTDKNGLLVSSSLTNWTGATFQITQRLCEHDNNSHAIGVACHWTGPDGELIKGINGKVPICFDGKPNRYFSYGSHQGRAASYAVLEPSKYSAHVVTAGADTNRLERAISHSDFVAEFTVRFANLTTPTSVGFWFRQDGAGNGYRLSVRNGATLLLEKVVAGTKTTVATGSGSENGSKWWNARVKVSAQGSAINAWLEGEHQINATDSAFSSGTHVCMSANAATADARNLTMRASDAITISGMIPGSSAVVRGAAGIPYATSIANENGQAVASLYHWPHDEIEINGISYNGEIWGGDTFSVDNPNKFRGRVTL